MITKEDSLYTIQGSSFTYQMKKDSYGKLIHTYAGAYIEGDASSLISFKDRGFSGNPYEAGKDRTYSYDYLPMEIGETGTGDFRTPGLVIRDSRGITASDLRLVADRIYKGLPDISPLPSLYGDAETLELTLEDSLTGNRLILSYSLISDALLLSRRFIAGEHTEVVKAASLSLDIPYGDYDLVSFAGRHCYERQKERTHLLHQDISLTSRRGSSSHQMNPFAILCSHDADEDRGECFAMHLLWSSSFRLDAGKSQFGNTRINFSMLDETMDIILEKGEELQLPAALLTYSADGFQGLSIKLSRLIRKHAIRKADCKIENPVLLNSWEACYFSFTGKKLIKLASEAAKLGADLFVLDDGWFKGRNDDLSSLGDWTEDKAKLGMTLAELGKKIKQNNILFGLWVEPEMINEDSDLYRQHPDWAFKIPGRNPMRARYQLVLDLSREDVYEYLLSSLRKLLSENPVDYVKWDMNRSLSDIASEKTQTGKILYQYEINLYRILSSLRKEFPHVLIEGCAGGGGRFDLGMLCYTPQIWLSDNTDAIDRINIQHDSSYGYPIAAFGSHVSVCPNHQNGRITPLETRSNMAMLGSYGLELDPGKLNEDERQVLSSEISFYRENASLIKNGDFYRLRHDKDATVFLVVSEDRKEALLVAVHLSVHGNPLDEYVRLKGLDAFREYTLSDGRSIKGSLLMNAGLLLNFPQGEYASIRIKLQAR